MAYQEQQTETKRTVVETPNARREVVQSETARYPERSGLSGGAVAAIVVGVIALAAIIVFFVMNRQQDVASQSPPQTTIVQQPAQQPPVIVQQPTPATQAPVIINNPTSGGSNASTVPDDSGIRAAIDKKLSNDPNFSSLGIVASVANGKVTLTGTVKTEILKAQAERAVRNVKGVKVIDNQITVG